jgi:hypothetical protein
MGRREYILMFRYVLTPMNLALSKRDLQFETEEVVFNDKS